MSAPPKVHAGWALAMGVPVCGSRSKKLRCTPDAAEVTCQKCVNNMVADAQLEYERQRRALHAATTHLQGLLNQQAALASADGPFAGVVI